MAPLPRLHLSQPGPLRVEGIGIPPPLSPDHKLDWVNASVDATRSTYRSTMRLAVPVSSHKARIYLHVAAYVEVGS